MTNLIFNLSILITGLLLALYSQTNIIHSKAFAQLPIPTVKPNVSSITTTSSTAASNSNNATITAMSKSRVVKRLTTFFQYVKAYA